MASRTTLLGSSVLAALFTLALVPSGRADVIIGDWENGSTDGWIDWSSQAAISAPTYTFDNTIGVTHGSSSIHVSATGFAQTLSIKLQNTGHKADFLANKQFSIDFTVPPNSDPSGYSEVYDLAINAEGYGFQGQGPTPKKQFGFPNGNAQTATLTWDYSALVDGNPGNGEIASSANWIELILATNGDHGNFYFDNARLTSPHAPGDFNGNGSLDATDIDALFHATAGANTPATAQYDVNSDGTVTPAQGAAGSDADYWVTTLKGTRYGDANLDKKVNFADLVVLAQHYNQASGATWDLGSFNGDGKVNFADLVLLAQNYNFNGASAAQLAALEASNPSFAADWALAQSFVPEPTSLAAVGLGALVLRRRRA